VEWWILYLIIGVVIAALVAGYFYLKKKGEAQLSLQKELIDKHKMTTTILVLSKRMDKIDNAKIPKDVIASIPKLQKLRKVPLVTAKIGPQVLDLMCDNDVYEKIPEKKNVKVDIAGIFIAGISKEPARKGRR